MAFIPYVSPPQASPAALDLGYRIAEVIRNFQRDHPGTTPADVRQALRVAQASTGIGNVQGASWIIAVLTGLLAFGLALGLLLFRRH